MADIPTITVNEVSEPMYPAGSGGDNICVIADAGFTKDVTKIYTFGNYNEARGDHSSTDGIGPEPADWDDNVLLATIRDIFAEGAQTEPTHTLGIEKVYAINVGDAPSNQDISDAIDLAATIPDCRIEVLPQVSDLTNMGALKASLVALDGDGDFRLGIIVVSDVEDTISDMTDMTDTENTPAGVSSDRILIESDPAKVGKLAAKIATTPYYIDPAYGAYRSLSATDLYNRSRLDLDTLVAGGVCCDWLNPDDVTKMEPCMCVSTAFRLLDGSRPVSSFVHARRNADEQFRQIIQRAKSQLKRNNTLKARMLIEQNSISYLEEQKKAENIEDYLLDISVSTATPYGIIINAKVRPAAADYFITFNGLVQTPTGGA